MSYIRNADLTMTDVLLLAIKCGYNDITDEWLRTQGYALVLDVGEGEIAGFTDLPHARRFLVGELQYRKSEHERKLARVRGLIFAYNVCQEKGLSAEHIYDELVQAIKEAGF